MLQIQLKHGHEKAAVVRLEYQQQSGSFRGTNLVYQLLARQ
jgi:hypothetical protein